MCYAAAGMDFSRFLSPGRFTIRQDGRYLYALPQDLPVSLVLYRFDQAYPAVPNYHDHYEIGYVLGGEGTCRTGGRVHRCSEGDILMLGAGVFHFVEPAGKGGLEALAVYFAPEVVRAPGSTDVDLEYLMAFPGTDVRRSPRVTLGREGQAAVLGYLECMARELADRGDFHRIAVKNALCEILLLVSRSIGSGRASGGALRVPLRDARRLGPVFGLIRRGYTERIAHAELARAAHMSAAGFSRYFRRVTGHTVTEYISRFRVDKAKELLVSGDHAVIWIAHEVGFQSHSYFDRVFRAITGLTPHVFRARYAPLVPMDPPADL